MNFSELSDRKLAELVFKVVDMRLHGIQREALAIREALERLNQLAESEARRHARPRAVPPRPEPTPVPPTVPTGGTAPAEAPGKEIRDLLAQLVRAL